MGSQSRGSQSRGRHRASNTQQSTAKSKTQAKSKHKQSKTEAPSNISDGSKVSGKQSATTMSPPLKKSSAGAGGTGGAGGWSPGTYTALKALVSARLCSAVWGLISDCDETYNYWEPTHYLLYGSGMQTWEYDPAFSLRSYLYLLVHAAPAWLYATLLQSNRVLVFFFVRCLLALLSASCDLYFYRGVVAAYGGVVGRATLCLQVFSAGVFVAATAYLPSSAAMHAVSLGVGAWLRGKLQLSVVCVATAALLAWPFTALLGVPLAVDIVFRRGQLSLLLKWSGLAAAAIMVPMMQVDYQYYGRLVVAPLNILLYNVFGGDRGADLYGTEPPSFYLLNGLINFNVAFLAALVALPLCCLREQMCPPASKAPRGEGGGAAPPAWLALAPLYLWLAVFWVQPHKEERFLFPVYPLLCLAAALALESVQRLCEAAGAKLRWRMLVRHARLVPLIVLTVSSMLSVSRILAVYKGYHAPLSVFLELQNMTLTSGDVPGTTDATTTHRLCLGKDWHRFPSSFFLPDDSWEVRFIRSEFRGQLPQPFLPGPAATATARYNFNALNQEEEDRYVDVASCEFLIDSDGAATPREPRYFEEPHWRTVVALPFLDAPRSHPLLRVFYVPYLTEAFCSYRSYRLLQRTAAPEAPR